MAKRKKGNTGQLKMEFNTPSKPKTQSVGSKLNRTEALRNKAQDLGVNKNDRLRTQNTNKPNTSSNTKTPTGNKPSDRANRTKDLRAKNVGSKEAIAQAKINKLRTNNKSLEAAKKVSKSGKGGKAAAIAATLLAVAGAITGGVISAKKSDTKSSVAKAKAKVKAEKAKVKAKVETKTEAAKKTETKKTETAKTETKATDNTSIEQKVKDVIRGKYGTGAARKAALGADYDKVQAEVNKKMAASKLKIKSTSTPTTSAKTETQDSPDKAEITEPKELQMTAEQRMYDNIDKLKKEKMKKGGMVKMKYGGTMKPTMKKGGLVKKKK